MLADAVAIRTHCAEHLGTAAADSHISVLRIAIAARRRIDGI
jgi:hypothetical protein